jgi:uncharacterized lipoprotein YajG
MKNRKQKMNTKNTNMSTTNKLARGAMVAVLAVAAMGMGGCAFNPATRHIDYQTSTGATRVANAENIAVSVTTIDSRADKKIGQRRNTYGMNLAKISSDEPVEKTVNNAIEKELQARGFRIDDNSKLKVTADVTDFFSHTELGLAVKNNAKINLSVVVQDDGKTLYEKQVASKGQTKSYIGQKIGDIKESLEIALSNEMTNLFDDKDFIAAITPAPAASASN